MTEFTEIECELCCPGDGQDVMVRVECSDQGRCRVTRCSHFGEGTVICSQQCLEEVTHGTHWDNYFGVKDDEDVPA